MSSRGNYIETDILAARNIIFFRPEETNTHIQAYSAPVIGSLGRIKWLSSLEFISSMKETLPIYDLREGLSTVHSNVQRDTIANRKSTVAGIGSISYISTSGLTKAMATLTYTYGYISSTVLYDCINTLTDLQHITDAIGPMVKFIRGSGKGLRTEAL